MSCTEAERILSISDLHPEKGDNPALRSLLKHAAKDWTVIFNGDCLQYPNSYKRVPHLAIAGNHDSGKCDILWRRIGDTVFTHSHRWDPHAETGGLWRDSLWSFFKHLFGREELSQKTRPVVILLDEMLKRKIDEAERERIRTRILPDLQMRAGGDFEVLVMGHRHVRYAVEVDGVLCLNSGAGWRGEYVTINRGEIFFHAWR